MRILLYSIVFLFLFTGCQQQQQANKEPEEEKVLIYVVQSDQSPVQGFTISLGEAAPGSPDVGWTIDPTDADGKTETTLKVGTTYDAYLVIDDDTTQYEKFTVSEDEADNEFTFVLKD
ncbi:hypothetical protein CAI16_04015 [Virgibacillus dokdonensis]|uniref:Uncharacterized protein n=1 Tax=Virgibacillus dokdonensis TaxID=302167 RepID=A0A3E0WUW9_9BACI|nr:hypothetical protein [Virgibacillus dokdonensis]RFA36780.1 hypothetical protein CAI16_04015 [Virgibacillus dokdonensis]